MKKELRKLAALLLAGVLLTGCGIKKQTAEEQEKTDEGSSNQTEEVLEDTDVMPDSNTSDTEEDTKEKEEEKSEENEKKDQVEIDLPDEENLVTDYTSVKGLILEKGSRLAFVVKGTNTGYWQAVKKGIDQAIGDLNQELGYNDADKIQYTFEGPKVEGGVDEQVNILDAVISENPDVLCLAAVDMDSCEAQLEAARENGIPVIILDSGVTNNELIDVVCATDNYSAGVEAAKRLCEIIGDQGEIAVAAHLQLGESSQERVKGFENEIAENHPNVTVVAISYETTKDGEPSIEEQMKETLDQYPQLKGYFCTNEVMSEKALTVLKDYADRNIQLVGFDLGKTQAEAIRNGTEAGVVCQNPYGMGYATVVAAVRAALNMRNDEFIDSGYQWLDKTTIDLEENAKYLYE